jgi:hypothetical protein
VAKRLLPLHDATAPIVCTIEADEIPGRIELLERLRRRLGHLERTEHGLLLRYAPDAEVEADLRRFVADETRCCAFWGFEVEAGAAELTLRWEGPPDAQPLLDRLHASFEGDEPLTGIAGLL